MNNFFTGYLKYEDVPDLNTAKELDRQHNIGLLKGFFGAILCGIISYFLFKVKF